MSECVETTNSRNKAGYGQCLAHRHGRKIYLTHVLAWIDANGRLPEDGMKILHSCDNPPCVNPEHLREGTQAENNQESVAKGRSKRFTHDECVNGHSYSRNVYVDAKGCRHCRLCRADASRRYYEKLLAV